MTRSGRRAFFQAQVVFKQRVVKAKSVLVVVFMCVFAARLAELVIIAICAAAGTVNSARTRRIAILVHLQAFAITVSRLAIRETRNVVFAAFFRALVAQFLIFAWKISSLKRKSLKNKNGPEMQHL